MRTIWNKISLGTGLIGGFLVSFWGGWDSLMVTLITLMAVDYITGIFKAVYLKKLSSEIGYKGIMKKALVLIIIGVAVAIQTLLPDSVPLREITIMFFVCNEGLSILENAATIIPLPEKLKDVLLQLRHEEQKKDSGKNEKKKEEKK